MQQFAAFLKALTAPAWICCSIAVAAACVSVYAWWPAAHHPKHLAVYVALAAMGATLIAGMSMIGHHLITWEYRRSPQPRIRLPRIYWQMLALAGLYFLAVCFGTFAYYPHGVDLGPTVSLRIACAVAVFMSIAALGFTQWAGLRVRALQSAP